MGRKTVKVTPAKILARIYYNPQHGSSFSSPARLAKAAKLPLHFVKEWLLRQETYTTHFPARKRSKNISFYNSHFPHHTWEIDLIDLSRLVEANYPFRYALTVIDCFSRQGDARPLKSKQGVEVSQQMEDVILSAGVTPVYIQCDEGGEFLSAHFQRVLQKYKIKFRIARNQHHAAIAERFNRTLKSKLFKYLTYKETERWVDILPEIVKGYNKTPHRSLGGLSPNDVTEKNSYSIWEQSYLRNLQAKKPFSKPKFRQYDFVRVSKSKKLFEKAYTQSFSTEVYKINKVIYRSGIYVYQLISLLNEVLKGLFYDHELVRVYYTPDAYFKIERILNRRIRPDGSAEIFVKWKGWHTSHNSWVPESWTKPING